MVVWIILALCVLAVPTAVFTQNLNKESAPKAEANPIRGQRRLFWHGAQRPHRSCKTLGHDHRQGRCRSFQLLGRVVQLGSEDLRKALANDKIKGVLLRVNSPGGTVPTSQEIHQAVTALRKKGKPVVVSMGDVAAPVATM